NVKKAGAPRIVFVRCSSDPFPCRSHSIVTRTGKLLVGAGGMSRRAKVVFPVRSRGGKVGTRAVGGRLRTKTPIVVTAAAVAARGGSRAVHPGRLSPNAARLAVANPPKRKRAPRAPSSRPVGPSAFDGDGMWIWYLSKSEGGSPTRIAAQAKAHGVST